MGPISQLTFQEQSHLFAVCSKHAYEEPINALPLYLDIGFASRDVFSEDSEIYISYNKTDIVISCRGTEFKKYADIKTDFTISQTDPIHGEGEIHKGFKDSVDRIWMQLTAQLLEIYDNHEIWVTGHSLGAAMGTIIATYLQSNAKLPNIRALFTYGSPRVGNKEFIKHMEFLNVEHHRYVNNCDIVPRVPFWKYKHHTNMKYMNHWGNVAEGTKYRRVVDVILGTFKGLLKLNINFLVNHDLKRYIHNLENWKNGKKRKETFWS